MKKLAKDLKKGDPFILGDQTYTIESIEFSDIGKHGKRKCRIEAKNQKNEKIVIIRPEDYPIES